MGIRLQPRVGDLVDRFEQFRRPLTGQRGDVEDLRVVEELHLLAQLVVEPLREILAAPLHQVPLVGGDDDAAPGLLRLAGDRRVLVGRPLDRIDDEHGDVGLRDRAARDEDADSTPPARPRATRPARRIPAVSRIRNVRFCHLRIASTVSRVVPGMALTIDRSSFSNRFSSDDFPTFGRPTIATLVSASRAGAGASLLPSGKRAIDLVQQVTDPLPVLRGNLDDRLEAEGVELDRSAPRAAVVGLVDRDQDGGADDPGGAGDLFVPGHQPLASVHNEDDEIRRRNRLPAVFDHQFVEGIAARPEHAPGVHERKLVPCHSAGWAMVSRVVPATGATMARRVR